MQDTAKSFVFDAEAVAIDRTTGKLMPFQELSRRKRKDVKVEDIQVRVCLFAFDLLYLNGEVMGFHFPVFNHPLIHVSSVCFRVHIVVAAKHAPRAPRAPPTAL